MSYSLNEVRLIGRLGKDPEVRSTTSGATVACFSVATSAPKRGSDEEVTEWHNVVCFDKAAEWAGEKLHKGNEVYVSGRISTRKWQDKNGNDRSTTEVIAQIVKRFGSGESREEAGNSHSSSNSRPPQRSGARNYGPATRKAEQGKDEELPF